MTWCDKDQMGEANQWQGGIPAAEFVAPVNILDDLKRI